MLLIFSVLAVVVVIMLSIFAQIDNWQRDWTTNFAKLDPAAEDPNLRPLSVPENTADVARLIERWAGEQPKWSTVSVEKRADGSIVLHLTRTTPVLRFTDDIQVTLQPTEKGTLMNAESQSRIGKGDLGQNPRNLKALRSASALKAGSSGQD